MQAFILIVFTVFFVVNAVVPGSMTRILPDLFAAVAILIILAGIFKQRSVVFPPKYVLFFVCFGLFIIIGWIINQESSGAMVIGIRYYFKGFLFFLLPFAYRYSDEQTTQQLKLLLALGLLQLPVALLQRFVLYFGLSGDLITGTLGPTTSGLLSTVLTFQLAILTAFFAKGWIRPIPYFVILLALFLPTTLNETKAMLAYLPVALILPFVFSGYLVEHKMKLLGALAGLGVIFGIFAFFYQYTTVETSIKVKTEREDSGIVGFLDPQKIYAYLAPQQNELSGKKYIGRVDKIIEPLERLSEDPVKLLVGYGLGNAIKTPIEMLAGDYADETDDYLGAGVYPRILWETGLLGLAFTFILLWMIYRDADHLSREDGFIGIFATGGKVTVILVLMAMFYTDIITREVSFFMVAYYFGYFASERARRDLEQRMRSSARRESQNVNYPSRHAEI